jgi:hypothetical protein
LTRRRTANHPRGGISLGRSASLPAASPPLPRSATWLLYSPEPDGEELPASDLTSWALSRALSARP